MSKIIIGEKKIGLINLGFSNLLYIGFIFFCFCSITQAQNPVNLKSFDAKGEAKVNIDENLINVTWLTGEHKHGRLIFDMQQGRPLIKSIQLEEEKKFTEISTNLDPTFLLTVGHRNLDRNGWTVFFDNPAYRSHKTYSINIEKKNAKIVSEGSRTHIIINKAIAGPFSGTINVTLYDGSPLMKVAAELSTNMDSVAIDYDAGLMSQHAPWQQIFWSDPQNYIKNREVHENEDSKKLAVKYRTIIGQSNKGSIAVFPPPHQYFYPLDNAYNEKFTWYGRNYRNKISDYGIGIRHNLLGDRRWVPWFNAPPHTKQELNFFCLLSTEEDGKVLEQVKRYTHDDKYKPLAGYYTMSAHFHQEHTNEVLTHMQGAKADKPDFVKAFRKTGVNIVHLAEFHLNGNREGPDALHLKELQTLYKETARLSDGNFLLLPGAEPNHWFGGHWISLFPEPVYWIMSRDKGEPFVKKNPKYGKVYHIGNEKDMLKLLKEEKGLVWTSHPRIKGSIGYPDRYKDKEFYKSDRFLGAGWKALPADLSHPELGKRALDLMDDMANWGQEKYMLAETDIFKVRPGFELYGHLNVNYLQLDKLPQFKNGWGNITEALQNGKFFSTTGEVLLPEFTVNGKGSGEHVKRSQNGKVDIHLKADWTFPLNYMEIISGDGDEVYKKKISLKETKAFGEKNFDLSVNLKNRKWVRIEVWDTAANGAFTQFVWLK